MTLHLIGQTVIAVRPGAVTTMMHDGALIHAEPHDTDEYAAKAETMGYGNDVERMNREHDLAHALLAHWLGLRESPVLRAVANDAWHDDADGRLALEEAAVEAVCKFAIARGVNLLDLAENL